MKIITHHICPPIPNLSHDWLAYYAGDEDGLKGWGRTEEEAIKDLENSQADIDERCKETMETARFEEELFEEMDKMRVLLVGSKALAKAIHDPFDYALKLRAGEVITFEFAEIIDRDWVRLHLKKQDEQPNKNRLPFPAPRGMDVRLSDIVWVMDAPEGS